MSGLSITICYLSIYLSIYRGVVEGGGSGPRAGGAPTTPNQLWGGPACKSLRTPDLDNPNSADFRTLVHSFDLQQVPTPPTHTAGKELDLILARNCTTDNLSVTPLHRSDHFIRFDVRLIEQPSVPPPMV